MLQPRFQRRHLLLALVLLPLLPARAADALAPSLMLARIYCGDVPLSDYWVSERYDGVRGYWDGKQLLTRGEKRVAAPA